MMAKVVSSANAVFLLFCYAEAISQHQYRVPQITSLSFYTAYNDFLNGTVPVTITQDGGKGQTFDPSILGYQMVIPMSKPKKQWLYMVVVIGQDQNHTDRNELVVNSTVGQSRFLMFLPPFFSLSLYMPGRTSPGRSPLSFILF
jgi:hypothetical protein